MNWILPFIRRGNKKKKLRAISKKNKMGGTGLQDFKLLLQLW